MTLARTIRQCCDERGVRFADAVAACERALVAAAEHVYGDARTFEASYDAEEGEIVLHTFMAVVETVENPNTQVALAALEGTDTYAELGEDVGFQVFYLPQHASRARAQDEQFGALLGLEQHRDAFGRIAIHQAKQALIHALRIAERERVCSLYEPLVGQLVAGVVDKVGRHDHATVSLGGGISGLLPKDQQHPRDRLAAGEWVVCEVRSVSREDGPPLTLTRVGDGMVRQLLRFVVPEVESGDVLVQGIAREAGGRCKVRIAPRHEDINAAAACIGEHGCHVRELTEALLGERVDFIESTGDEAQDIMAALFPATPLRVELDDEAHAALCVVRDEDLPLAVGRRAENVRLASRLTGWAVSVVGESDAAAFEKGEVVA